MLDGFFSSIPAFGDYTDTNQARRKAVEELFERYYDNPVDNDGNQKQNKSLGTYEIIENLESDFYNSMRIAKSADNKIYLVIEREVSGYNGGSRLRLLEIKNVQHRTTAST